MEAVDKVVTELVNQTHAWVLAWAKTSCPSQEVLFPVRFIANNKTSDETGTLQALFNGQSMEKQAPSSQINFSTQFGWRHQIHRRVEVKVGEIGKRGRNIHEFSENRSVVWT